MRYEFESANGEKTVVKWSNNGTIIYSVGNRTTEFSIDECSDFTFEFCDKTSHKLVCDEDGVNQLHLIILHGEERLQRNNNDRETDEQWRLEAKDDNMIKIADINATTEKEVYRRFDAEQLRRAISNLKPLERQIVEMYWFKEFKQIEIADMLGITYESVKKKCQRILKTLKKYL